MDPLPPLRPIRPRRLGAYVAFALATALTGCSGPEAPDDPIWADVYPILHGQCLHCHGPTAETDGAGYRFDFLDAAALCKHEPGDDLGTGFVPEPSFLSWRKLIERTLSSAAPGQRPKMPPEPARLLEPWQVETIQRFVAKLDALPAAERALAGRGPVPASARPPRIAVRYAQIGSAVWVDYTVTDENADPVIGELRLGPDLLGFIKSTGAGRLGFNLAGLPAGTPLQMTARLCDGWGIRLRGPADGLPLITP